MTELENIRSQIDECQARLTRLEMIEAQAKVRQADMQVRLDLLKQMLKHATAQRDIDIQLGDDLPDLITLVEVPLLPEGDS